MKRTNIKRGDIFWVDFDPSKGTETKKRRPALVCSHDTMNENTARVIVAPITSNVKKIYSFEYALRSLPKVKGKIMFDQMTSADKVRLGKKLGKLSVKEMREIDEIIKFILGVQ